MTEEYDEDSPFSRPPKVQLPKPEKQTDDTGHHRHSKTPDSHSQIPSSTSTDTATVSDQHRADSTGNGSQPASGDNSDAVHSTSGAQQHGTKARDALRQVMVSEQQSQTPSVGRGQVYSDADTPDRLPVR